MRHKPFEFAKPRAKLANHSRSFGSHPLVRARFQKLPDPQTARIPSRFACGQRVIGADHFIAKRDIRFWSEKDSAEISHLFEEIVWILGHHLHMLRRNVI